MRFEERGERVRERETKAESPVKQLGWFGEREGRLRLDFPLNNRFTESATIRRCDLVEVGVTLLKEAFTDRLVLRSQMLKPSLVSHILPAVCKSGCKTLNYLSSAMFSCRPPCFLSW